MYGGPSSSARPAGTARPWSSRGGCRGAPKVERLRWIGRVKSAPTVCGSRSTASTGCSGSSATAGDGRRRAHLAPASRLHLHRRRTSGRVHLPTSVPTRRRVLDSRPWSTVSGGRSRRPCAHQAAGPLLPEGYTLLQATGPTVDDSSAAEIMDSRSRSRRSCVTRRPPRRSGNRPRPCRSSTEVPSSFDDGQLHVTPMGGRVRPPRRPISTTGSVRSGTRAPSPVSMRRGGFFCWPDGRSTRAWTDDPRDRSPVASALGIRDALNLDGGGSTTMVVGRPGRQPAVRRDRRATGRRCPC